MIDIQAAVSRLGRRALILHPASKRPMGTGWQHGQSAATRALLLAQHPDANIGCLTGDGLAVLDMDPRHGGHQSLAALEREHGPLPDSYGVLTGGGGRHIYFRADRAQPTFQVAPGLEVRAHGAQVVAPPSIHPDTGRQYVDDPAAASFGTFAALPGWLQRHAPPPNLVQASPRAASDAEWIEEIPPPRYAEAVVGARPDRHGFILCPSPLYTAERTPSLELFDTPERGWRCHRGCCRRPDGRRAGGSIYAFTAHAIGYTEPLRGTTFLYIRDLAERLVMEHAGVQI